MKTGRAAIEAQLGWGHPTYIAAMTQYEDFLEECGQLSEAAEVRAQLARVRASVAPSGELALGNSVPTSAKQ